MCHCLGYSQWSQRKEDAKHGAVNTAERHPTSTLDMISSTQHEPGRVMAPVESVAYVLLVGAIIFGLIFAR